MKRLSCRTRYPIVLVHGIGYNDDEHPHYWGRVPEALRGQGATIYFGGQSSYGSVTDNAREIRDRLLTLQKRDGWEKVNLIAHSKGGIEARYLISGLGTASLVASLTTVATPHRGIAALDRWKETHPKVLARLYDLFGLLILADGGKRPRDHKIYGQLSRDYMTVFNGLVPDAPEVYYQSYACDMVRRQTDPALGMFYEIVRREEGENDGLVSVSSARWGEFRGIYRGSKGTGVSHSMACGGRGRRMEKNGQEDISAWYVEMVDDLRRRGY